MLSQLSQADKVVGVKQSRKAIKDGLASQVLIAEDAEMRVLRPIRELCTECNVPIIEIETMKTLGEATGIDVGAAVVTILK